MPRLNKVRMWTPLFFLIALLSLGSLVAEGIRYPDFETSMLRTSPSQNRQDPSFVQREIYYQSKNQNLIQMFKSIYDNNIKEATDCKTDKAYRIPRIVHQIWLGSPVPEAFRNWMSSWANLKGWTYILWTDVEAEKFVMHNRELYNLAENYAEKADILRLEILHQHGGLYVDIDCECVNPAIFDELNKCYDFYIGFEPLEHGLVGRFNMFQTCNAVMASIPYHPLVKELVTNLKANFFAYKSTAGACHKTGPSYLTRMICAYEKGDAYTHRNMYLPSTFFYPFSEPEMIESLDDPDAVLPTFPETALIHYWYGTWRQGTGEKYVYGEDNL